MAADTSDGVTWVLTIADQHRDLLGGLRAWPGLQVAFAENKIWVTGFSAADLDSVAVRTIPHKTLYYSREGRLFPQGSQLAARHFPVLLWSAIRYALPVDVPMRNYNFFGGIDPVSVSLQPTQTEQPAVAMVTSVTALESYVPTAPAVRLNRLRWALLNETDALLIGEPLLPIPGTSFWQKNDWLLPTGFDTEWPILDETLRRRLNPDGADWLLWNPAGTFGRVTKTDLVTLSIGSFRRTIRS